eukprot:scaffold22482_cov69-Phaeocystis_antarctica.AAC.5
MALLKNFLEDTCRDVNLSVFLTLEEGRAFDSSRFKPRNITLVEGIPASKIHDDIKLELKSATSQGSIDLLGYINGSLKELAEVIVRSMGKKGAHIAAIYQGDAPGSFVLRVRVSDINLLQTLRDNIMLGNFAAELCEMVKQPGQLANANSTALASDLEPASPQVKPQLPNDLTVEVNLTAFANMYESSILRLDKLTPHQVNKLSVALGLVDSGQNLHVKAPAGAGKTFVAMQLILLKLREGPVLYVAVCSATHPALAPPLLYCCRAMCACAARSCPLLLSGQLGRAALGQ